MAGSPHGGTGLIMKRERSTRPAPVETLPSARIRMSNINNNRHVPHAATRVTVIEQEHTHMIYRVHLRASTHESDEHGLEASHTHTHPEE